jgi:hypothetical protein
MQNYDDILKDRPRPKQPQISEPEPLEPPKAGLPTVPDATEQGGLLPEIGEERQPKQKKTSETKKRHRDRLLEFGPAVPKEVPSRPATCGPTCYEIEPGRWVHHPWRGCTTPAPEWQPVTPTEPDCGCSGAPCSRCWLCPEHCRCLPEGTCSHCRGEGYCLCSVCTEEGREPQCVFCKGTGKSERQT